MRKLLSLIAVAAVVACSDTPVQPTSDASSGHLIASLDATTGGTDTSATLAGDTTATSPAPADTTGADGGATGTDSATADPTPSSSAPASALQPLYCPSPSDERSARGVIGPQGGKLGLRGHELKLPAGAVSEPTEFEIVVPVSEYMQIEVHAVGRETLLFDVPASITISFQRCTSLPPSALTAAYVDKSNSIVQNMGGAVDRVNKKVSFSTGHLSGYMVAY